MNQWEYKCFEDEEMIQAGLDGWSAYAVIRISPNGYGAFYYCKRQITKESNNKPEPRP